MGKRKGLEQGGVDGIGGGEMKIKEITKPMKYKLIVTDEEYEVIKRKVRLPFFIIIFYVDF